jgi:hypothetical protein
MEAAKRFLQNIEQSEWDLAGLVRAAARHGYHFSADELQAAADELLGDLSEEQLRGMVGGGGNGRPDRGPVDPHSNPPPGHTDRSGGWAPRAGDVSGNSCFFIRGGNN